MQSLVSIMVAAENIVNIVILEACTNVPLPAGSGMHGRPHRISKLPNNVALEPGTIVSNELGYYKEGHYGTRTEKLQVVTPASAILGDEREMLGFETLTLAPIDKKLMATVERDRLDAYHARLAEVIGPQLSGRAKTWLEHVTAKL